MKTVFAIDRENGNVATPVPVAESEWVLNNEGIATIKHDGTSCMIKDGTLFKRYDAKHGKTPPSGWTPCEDAPDAKTGHWPGWLPVADAPENKHHLEAFNASSEWADGTYELVGPKVQGNKYGLALHELWRHGKVVVTDMPRTFEGMRDWLLAHDVEGIVFHHPDGRMAKIRRKDFRFKW